MKKVFTICIGIFICGFSIAQTNIQEARAKTLGSSVTIKGIVTSGVELGVIRYMQDETAGIAVYSSTLSDVKRGDSITVTGILKDYNKLLEIDPVSDLIIHSSDNNPPAPQPITPNQLSEAYESELVSIKDVSISNAGSTFTGNTSYTLTSGNESTTIYVKNGSPLVGELIPSGLLKVVGICSQYSFSDPNGGYQLMIRDFDDIQNNSSIYLTSAIDIENISNSGFDLKWTTNIEGSTQLYYGHTPSLELGLLKQEETVTNHTLSITGANPSELFYVKAMAVAGSDTSYSSIFVFITQSQSSGEIKTYFNTAVDNSVSSGVDAIRLDQAIDDTLIQYINRAEATIDIAIYNINNSGISNISTAINNAFDRGVNIRIVHDGGTACLGLNELNNSIPTIASPQGSSYGLMHNKFIVFDANLADPNKALVWTGSTNLTVDNLYEDANNVVIIQDKSLALAYKLEFEEMWGSSTLTPNASLAKFGSFKKDNTPHNFVVGGNDMELYFSPSDQTNDYIIDAINSANNDLSIETMLITRTDISDAIVSAHQAGAITSVITNSSGENSDLVNTALTNELGSYFTIDNISSGTLHSKLMIVDQTNPSSDPLVLTGSHNWSNAANNLNDENTLIIHNATIANIYFQQFIQRYTENGGEVSIHDTYTNQNSTNFLFQLFPNPNNGEFTLTFDENLQGSKEVTLIDYSGRIIYKEIIADGIAQKQIGLSNNLAKGYYILQIKNKENISFKNIVIN